MRIELCEDNGALSSEGKPTLVILVITKDDGKQIRVPYQASKKISDLYVEARKLAINKDIKAIEDYVVTGADMFDIPKIQATIDKKIDQAVLDNSNVIQREDIVRCFRQERDLDNNVNEEIEIGHEYRVIDIVMKAGKIVYYEVLNDEKKDMMRIPVLPSEIELVRKFVRTGGPRKQVFEIVKKCKCGETNSLELNGDRYEGKCEKCGNVMTEYKKVPNAQSA